MTKKFLFLFSLILFSQSSIAESNIITQWKREYAKYYQDFVSASLKEQKALAEIEHEIDPLKKEVQGLLDEALIDFNQLKAKNETQPLDEATIDQYLASKYESLQRPNFYLPDNKAYYKITSDKAGRGKYAYWVFTLETFSEENNGIPAYKSSYVRTVQVIFELQPQGYLRLRLRSAKIFRGISPTFFEEQFLLLAAGSSPSYEEGFTINLNTKEEVNYSEPYNRGLLVLQLRNARLSKQVASEGLDLYLGYLIEAGASIPEQKK